MSKYENRDSEFLNFIAVSAAVLGLSLANCGKEAPQNVEKAVGNSVTEPDLALNRWQTNCQSNDYPKGAFKNSFSALGPKIKRYYQFSGNGFKESVRFYSDESCADPVAELQYEGDFDVRAKVKTDTGSDAREVDLNYTRVYMISLSDVTSKSLSDSQFFGVTMWDKGIRQDLTDRTNEPRSLLRSFPFTRNDIVQVKSGALYFGKTNPEALSSDLDSKKRPSHLSDQEGLHHSNRSW